MSKIQMTLNGHMSNITSAEASSLSTDKNQIGLRVQKINIRVHNQQATGCYLGAHSLRDEVVVRELIEASDHLLSYLSKSGQGLPTKGGGETKAKKGESKYQRHVLARQDRLCSPVGGVNFARLYGGV